MEVRRKRRDNSQSGEGIGGSSVTYIGGAYEGSLTHTLDAFTYRAFLVVLKFAQKTFYISIKNVEADTREQAVALSVARAAKCGKSLGDIGELLSSECLVDTITERERLKIGHEFDSEIIYLEMYPDNRDKAYWEPHYTYVGHGEHRVKGRPSYWD